MGGDEVDGMKIGGQWTSITNSCAALRGFLIGYGRKDESILSHIYHAYLLDSAGLATRFLLVFFRVHTVCKFYPLPSWTCAISH